MALTRSLRLLTRASMALAFAAVVLSGSSRAARADELANVDEAINRWKTLDIHYKIVTSKPNSDSSVIKLRMRMRFEDGNNQQMTEISAPADMKGTKVLIKSPTKMYIYLPAFNKIRRIASHVTEQGFLGTALSQRDMSLTRYGKFYTAAVSKDDGETATLMLTTKSDEAPYPKIELDVEKERWLPTEIRYFNDKGVHIKTESRSDYKCKGKICLPGLQKMADHTTKVTSAMEMKEHEIDASLPNEIFSKRYLQK